MSLNNGLQLNFLNGIYITNGTFYVGSMSFYLKIYITNFKPFFFFFKINQGREGGREGELDEFIYKGIFP